MNDIDVEIIVPFYNTSNKILKLLESFEKQTYHNFKVLFIDNNSTDGTSKLIEKNLKNVSYRIILEKAKGVSNARNCGIKEAEAKYIIFVDSDDYLNRNYIKELVNKIKITNSDLVYCNFEKIQENTRDINKNFQVYNSNILGNIFFKKYIKNKISISICTVIIKRELIIKNNIRFNSLFGLGEDRLFLAEVIYRSQKINGINQCLYFYLDEALTIQESYRKYKEEYEKSIRIWDELENKVVTKKEKKMVQSIKNKHIRSLIMMYYELKILDSKKIKLFLKEWKNINMFYALEKIILKYMTIFYIKNILKIKNIK